MNDAVARLLRFFMSELPRSLGIDEGLVTISKDFDAENAAIACQFTGEE